MMKTCNFNVQYEEAKEALLTKVKLIRFRGKKDLLFDKENLKPKRIGVQLIVVHINPSTKEHTTLNRMCTQYFSH